MEHPVNNVPEAPREKRRRRTKADIEKAIYEAAVKQISQKGFSKTLVTDIVREAQIEPVVFYNRYRNMDDFYAEFLKQYATWWKDLMEDIKADVTTEAGVEKYHLAMLDRLCEDPIMLELVRWEISEATPVTMASARHRQESLAEYYQILRDTFDRCAVDVFPIILLVGGGLVFFTLMKDRTPLASIDISSAEGKKILRRAIHDFSRITFAFKHHNELVTETDKPEIPLMVARERLRQEGVAEDIIDRVLEF